MVRPNHAIAQDPQRANLLGEVHALYGADNISKQTEEMDVKGDMCMSYSTCIFAAQSHHEAADALLLVLHLDLQVVQQLCQQQVDRTTMW